MTQIPNSKPSVFGHSNFEFRYYLGFRILILGFLLVPGVTHAGLIFKAPSSIGLISGLVGYWSFDGPDMAGNTAYDRSGSYATGTLTNGPQRAIGRIGQGLYFNENEQHVLMGSGGALNITGNQVSISAWIKPGTTQGQNADAIDFGFIAGNDGNGNGYGLWVRENARIVFEISGSKDGIANSSLGSIKFDDWNYVTAVYDGVNMQNYVNGLKSGSPYATTTNIASYSGNFVIGRWGVSSLYDFNGIIDDVRIYNRALNENEIRRLYRMGATLKLGSSQALNTGSLTQGLVGYWSFDESTHGTTSVADLSGNNNRGFMINGPRKAAGRIGQGLEFDGANDSVQCSDGDCGGANKLDFGSSDFSISVWAKISGTSNNSIAALVGKYDGDLGYYFGVNPGDTPGKIRFRIKIGVPAQTFVTVNNYVPDNVWHHYVAIADRDGFGYIYDNGVQVASADISAQAGALDNTASVFIGALQANQFINGSIDEVRVYNRALNENEIRRLYRMGATLKLGSSQALNTGTLKDGLVGYWSFDGNDMAGNVAYDRSGSYATGTLTNGPVRTAGKIGQALSFDGADDFVNIPDNSSLDLTSQITLSAWVNVNSSTNYQRTVTKEDTVLRYVWNFQIDGAGGFGTTGAVAFAARTAADVNTFCDGSTSITANGWYHIAATYDAATSIATLYLNGKKDGSGQPGSTGCNSGTLFSGNLQTSNEPLWIGKLESGGSNFFHSGLIDEVRIYNRALNENEIRRLYNMGR